MNNHCSIVFSGVTGATGVTARFYAVCAGYTNAKPSVTGVTRSGGGYTGYTWVTRGVTAETRMNIGGYTGYTSYTTKNVTGGENDGA